MQRDTILASLREIAFDFFYWVWRFEFALKEHGYLKSRKEGAAAEPGWDEFIKKATIAVSPSVPTAQSLLERWRRERRFALAGFYCGPPRPLRRSATAPIL